MPLCRVDQVPDATYAGVHVAAWGLALATGLLVHLRLRRRGEGNAWVAAGIGLMAVPAWLTLWSILPDLARTFCARGDLNLVIPPGQVVPATPRYDLSGQYIASLLADLGWPAAGLALVARGKLGTWRLGTHALAAAVRGWLPMGRSCRGEGASLLWGLALFPVLAAGNLLLGLATQGSGLRTGDDSHVFDQLSTLQALLLALAAGFGEEVVFRGVMQQGLKRVIPGTATVRVALAMAAQAIVFAYAHTGYANLEHLLFAFLFAIVAGLAVELLGIWAAIVLHVLIDLSAFTLGLAAASRLHLDLAAITLTAWALCLAAMLWRAHGILRRTLRAA